MWLQRLVYYIQFVSMIGQTGGIIPASNREFAQNYGASGSDLAPHVECVVQPP